MHRFLLFIVVICFFLMPGRQAFAQTTVEEAYLEELLGARSLPKYMHQDIDSGLGELVNNAEPYLTLIDDELVFPSDANFDSYSEIQVRYSRMIGLLETIGTEGALQILERAYGEVVEDMTLLNASYEASLSDGTGEEQRLALSRDADAAYSVFVSIVYVFKRLGDDRILDDVLARFQDFNYAMRLVAIKYNNEIGQGAIVERTVNTVAGWQVVGMPVEPLDKNYMSVYAETELIGTPWVWAAEGYESAEILTMGEAYWIQVQTAGIQSILGSDRTTLEVLDAPAGWNHLAGPGCDYPVVDLLASNTQVNPNQVYTWEPANGYVSLREDDVITQGSGFWVFLTASTTLTLSCPEANSTDVK